MSKSKSKNHLGISALILLVSGLVCKSLGALFRLPLTNLIGIEGIGIFQLIMSLYAFALVLTCGGITNSLSKLISASRARGEISKVSTYLKRALFVGVGIGLILGVIFLVFGRYISSFQGFSNSNTYYLFVVLLPLGAGLSALRGYFQGYENMVPTAVSQVIEQVFKFVFGLLFSFYFGKFGVEEGVFGAFLGITLSEFVSLLYLFVLRLYKNRNNKTLQSLRQIKFARKEFDKANFPLMLSSSILPLVNAFDGLVIVPRLIKSGITNGLATKLFGLQAGIVGAILNFPLIISIAVTTTLLPNISYLISRGSGGRHTIEKGLKLLLFLILPTTFGVVAISKQAFMLVYKDMSGAILDTAFDLMFYGAFSIVFTAIMQYLIMLLQANGKFKFILAITTLGGIAKANLSFFLSVIPSINIFALVFGNIALSAVVCLLALLRLKSYINFVLPFSDVFMLLFATFAMFLTVYTFINCNYFYIVWNIAIAVALGVLVYFVLTIPFIMKMKHIKERVKT